jgi:hypothetical protein
MSDTTNRKKDKTKKLQDRMLAAVLIVAMISLWVLYRNT